MEPPRVMADPAVLIVVAWLIFATFSTLVDAFYASKITPEPLYITKEAPWSKIPRKMFTKRLIQFTLLLFTTLLILSMTFLALNTSTIVARPQQVFVTPVHIRTSGRDQVFQDFFWIFQRALNERPPAPVIIIPPSSVSGFHDWLTSGNKMATHLSSFMPVVIIYTALLAVARDALNTNWSHLLPTLVVVARTAISHTSRSGLRVVLILLQAECAYMVWMALANFGGLLEDLLSPLIFYVELGLTFIRYLVCLSGVPLLIRSISSFVHAQVRYSITSVLTRLLQHDFLLWYIIAVATLLLARLLVGILTKRSHVQLAGALAFSGTALMALAIRLDPSTPRAQEATKEAEKDQEGASAVEGSPVAISHSSKNAPVDLSVFPILGAGLTVDKGPKEICESNRSLWRTMMNDQRPESTRLVSIHPPSATDVAVIEELLKAPASALQGSPQNITLTRSELVYVLMAVIEECNRRHQIVHDSLVKNNESAERRIKSEARKYRVLALELNDVKSELERTRESVVEQKDIRTNAASLGDSVMHQSEDGKTASASKLELAATPAHAGEVACTLAEDDVTSLQGLRTDMRTLRDLVRAMLMPGHCSGLEKGSEVDAFSSDSVLHPPVRDLIAGCDFARIDILRVISLLVIQRKADSRHNCAMLKKQQAFREELSDRVTELRKEYETQVEDLNKQLQRAKTAHDTSAALNGLYLRLSSKREASLKGEVEKRNEEVAHLQKEVYCLQRKVKDTEALKEELFGPVDFKEWVLQWFSRKDISRVTGTVLETRYRDAVRDLDKVITQMEVGTTQSDLLNQHSELLQYICTKLLKLDTKVAAAPPSTHSHKNSPPFVKPT